MGRVGFEWEDISGVLDKIIEEAQELKQAVTPEEKIHELGDLFFVLVNLARWMDVHAEDALRQANRRFGWRYRMMEELAGAKGTDFPALSLEEKESLWQEAKAVERRLQEGG